MFRLNDSVSEMLKSGSGLWQHLADRDISSIEVMVVDDDEFSREFVTRILDALGVGRTLGHFSHLGACRISAMRFDREGGS